MPLVDFFAIEFTDGQRKKLTAKNISEFSSSKNYVFAILSEYRGIKMNKRMVIWIKDSLSQSALHLLKGGVS